MLVPAAVLVLMVLGSIAVDFSIAYLGQRELSSAAAAAANDAVVGGVSDAAFYASGDIHIDADVARRVVDRSLSSRGIRGVRLTEPAAVETPGQQVCVTLRGRVTYIFARAIPGVPHHADVTGRAVATAVQGQRAAAVPTRAVCRD